MKGILLAGGYGTRLYPLTLGMSKQLMPIYDKPMIYYPLSVLMLAGIREILVICIPEHEQNFRQLLKNGKQFGVQISYATQEKPRGIADAFIVGKSFINNEPVALILGDNMFFGNDLTRMLKDARMRVETNGGSEVFCYMVKEPQRYGVIEKDLNDKALSIEEKPTLPKSNYAVVGLYFYDNSVVQMAKNIQPSKRSELEITDINQLYLDKGKLKVSIMGRGFSWLDMGTHQDLHEAGSFVRTIQARQGLRIACPEEIGFNAGWIKKDQILQQINIYKGNQYGEYLKQIVNLD